MPDYTHATQLTLRDGRRLAYAEHGAPGGVPVFVFHGAPGSRVLRHPDSSISQRLGVRIITVDRPGFGLSDPRPNRRLLDWPGDVAQLADSLGIQRFAVLGVSGGGPHAAACAYALPDRVTCVGLVSCPASFDVPGMRGSLPGGQRFQLSLAVRFPWAVNALMSWYGRAARKVTPEQTLAKLAKELPPIEAEMVKQPGMVEMMIADAVEALRQGGAATALELGLIAKPWGFRPEQITVPAYLWQGEQDSSVSPAMGQYLARAVPNCRATFSPGEGHLTGLAHWEEILTALVSHNEKETPAPA